MNDAKPATSNARMYTDTCPMTRRRVITFRVEARPEIGHDGWTAQIIGTEDNTECRVSYVKHNDTGDWIDWGSGEGGLVATVRRFQSWLKPANYTERFGG